MTDLTVVPVTAEMTILDRSHGEFMWDNSGSISGGLCILRWGLSGRQDSYMHNDPFPADGCLECNGSSEDRVWVPQHHSHWRGWTLVWGKWRRSDGVGSLGPSLWGL